MATIPSTLPDVLRNVTWYDFDPTRNCTSAGELFGQIYSDENAVIEMSFFLLANFARTYAPVPMDGITKGQIVDFHYYSVAVRNVSLLVLAKKVQKGCRREFCRNIKWGGNPDLSGIGVLMAFVIQATLTTLFAMIKLYKPLASFWNSKPQADLGVEELAVVTKSQSGIDKCLHIFWISAFYFGLCIGIASVAINVIEKATEQTAVFSLLGELFSTSVLLCLWPWYRQIKSLASHLHMAQCSLLLMAIFLLVISATSVRANWNSTFELFCFFNLKSKKKAGPLTVIPLVYVPAFLIAALWRWLYKRSRPVSSWRPYVEGFISLLSFPLMWISLGFFVEIRSEMSELVGSAYAENQWGFGQLLAVLAWLPTTIGFLKIIMWNWIEGKVAPKVTTFWGLRRDSIIPTTIYTEIQEPSTELGERQI